jgi:hypothetical protein
MTLTLKHFDTKLKLDTGVEEKLENSLAEYLYPDVEFAIGTVYPGSTTAQDLEEHEGKTLQFAAGERMYFASDDKVRSRIYPNASDGAAYGSLLFTPCRDFKELKNLRLIVIDDATGENGGFLPLDVAKNLVGDCYGKISLDLAEELTGNSNTPFQFRLGIKEQEKNPVARIAKGTLAPFRLEQVGEALIRDNGKTGYDMVLATSSFKGRKGGASPIAPGEYNLTVGLGIKTLAEYGKHSLGTQILVNYPRAVEADMLPRLKLDAMILANIQSDPRKIAQHYVETYERRKALVNAKGESKISDFEGDLAQDVESVFSNLGESGELNPEQQQQQDQLVYRLIKADLEGHFQILEHPKIIAELQEFVRASWVDIATGRAIKFHSGLAQPSLKLAENEICVPYIPEGEEIIVTRSPLVNSNGVIVLTNRHLPEVMKLSGTVHINPKTAADNLQADFDGDRLAFAHKRDFPTLAAEVKEYNLPANRYPDVVKKAKVPYQGTFAEIAVSAMENKIGLIANEIQKNVALQWETQLIPKEEQYGYLRRISAHLSNIGAKHKNGEIKIPEEILKQIIPITKLPASLTTEQVKQGLNEVKNLLRLLVGELSNELQVAVDGPKSALRPDESILKYCQEICNYTSVVWLTDKKNPEAFLNRGMKSTNHSPIDLMVKQTNQHFEENQLIARPTEQFRALYPGVEFTQAHKDQATTIKNTYNGLIKEAIRLEEKRKLEPGLSLIITSATSGRQLEITNLIKFDTSKNQQLWKATELDIKLTDHKATRDMPQTLAANITVKNPVTGKQTSQIIGTVSVASAREHNLKAGMTIKQGKVSFQPGVSKSMVEVAFSKASQYLETVRNFTAQSEKLPLAAALHNITHTEESHLYQGRKKASVAFAAFPDQIIGQLKELQFTNLSVVGTHQPSSEHNGRNWQGEKVSIKIELDADPRDPNISQRWVIAEGKKLAMFNSESPQLPTGTEAVATITSPPSASVIITSSKGNQLKVGQIKKYAFGDRSFQGELYTISIGFKSNSEERKPPTPLALVNGKALGVIEKDSFAVLSQKVQAANQSIESLKFNATIQSAPATTAHLIIDPTTVKYPQEWTNKDATPESEIIKTELEKEAQGVNTNTHTTQESEIIKTEPLIDTRPAPNEPTEPNPTPTIIREKWEQNLINASIKAIRALPHNQNAIIQTAPVGSKHTAIYSTSNNTLQIINDQQQVVYQATRDQTATINHLTEKQKSYWQTSTSKNQQSQSER